MIGSTMDMQSQRSSRPTENQRARQVADALAEATAPPAEGPAAGPRSAAAAKPEHTPLLQREIFGWLVFVVILVVAAAAAWGTYAILRQ